MRILLAQETDWLPGSDFGEQNGRKELTHNSEDLLEETIRLKKRRKNVGSVS